MSRVPVLRKPLPFGVPAAERMEKTAALFGCRSEGNARMKYLVIGAGGTGGAKAVWGLKNEMRERTAALFERGCPFVIVFGL